MTYFHPLDVEGRGRDAQLQVGENCNVKCSALSIKIHIFIKPVIKTILECVLFHLADNVGYIYLIRITMDIAYTSH